MKHSVHLLARVSYLVGALLLVAILAVPRVSATASGYAWTNISTSDTATHGLAWHSMASSASGQRLVAGLYLDDVWTSGDYGATWTNTTTANPSMHGYNWQAAASDATGQHLVLAAWLGNLWTSGDYGATWTNVSIGNAALTNKKWFSVASDSTGQYLAGAIYSGDIFTSSDYGATWTNRTPSGVAHLRSWQAIASDSTGQRIVGVVRDGDIYVSNDRGSTWTDVSTTTALNTGGLTWWGVAANATGQRLTAFTRNGDIYTSNDYGATWTNVSATTATGTHGLDWITFSLSGTGQYQAAAVANGAIWTSSDYGATWTKNAGTDGLNWSPVNISADGRRIAAQVNGGDIYTGINPDIQDSAIVPNTNDANGDGLSDSTQGNVRGSISPVTNQYALVQTGSECAVTSQSVQAAGGQDAQDSGYVYPVGLMNFTVQGCGAPGFTTTVTQYYYGVTDSDFVLRKYSPTTKQYTTIAGATITRLTIGGQSVIKAEYQVTDGGALDEDGAANGIIVDPAGLAVAEAPAATPAPASTSGAGAETRQTALGAPNTGLYHQGMTQYAVAGIAGLGILLMVGTAYRRRAYDFIRSHK